MTNKDWQAFIPGWNIIYMIKEHSKFNRTIADQKIELDTLRIEGERDIKLAQTYASEREKAKASGNLELAAQYDSKIIEIVQSHINKIR
jgi:hypothetical protein